jgi:putative glycosyl hydrolase
VTLGNIGDLFSELNHLYGKGKRVWITEYGYQTNPPDRLFGVSWRRQAAYMKQAYAIARKHPRIDMMLWFLLKDEQSVGRWQSGLYTFAGRKKPAFTAFRNLPR